MAQSRRPRSSASVTPLNPPRRKVVDERTLVRSRIKPTPRTPFAEPTFPPFLIKQLDADNVPKIAQDDMISGTFGWATSDAIYAAYAEGVVFLGYPYLATLAQRAEYRVVTETIAAEMTREWIELKAASGQESKAEKVKKINDRLDNLNVRHAFRKVAEGDGFFGRGHLYLDTGKTNEADELTTDIGDGRNAMSRLKIGIKEGQQKLLAVRPVEAAWAYPMQYESIDPLKAEWYSPVQWYVMQRPVHRSRFLTFVGREVPDILKPAYAFGGLSMSQMLKPYVDNWLKTRQSVADLIQSFVVDVLRTNMDATTSVGGDNLYDRVALFNNIKSNLGTMVIDKDSEDWSTVVKPLGGLDSLQAQSQEHMAGISRIPIVKLFGIQPAGLNASSEGELISFEDWIAAFQEQLFRPGLRTVIDFVQLSLFGEIDDDIIFEFKPLRQLRPKELADLQATKAQTREAYVTMGAVDGAEVREVLAQDPESPFTGLDLSQPLPTPGLEDPTLFGGEAPYPGETPGAEEGTDAALRMHDDVSFEHPAQGSHHCAECVHFQPGNEAFPCEFVQSPVEAEDWCELWDGGGGNDAGFEETKHPRGGKGSAKGGQFVKKGSGGGGGSSTAGKRQNLKKTTIRAWTGKASTTQNTIPKHALGALGEDIAVKFLKATGLKDAEALHLSSSNNFPLDLVGDHALFEVKTGVASSGTPRWRITIGQPGKAESAWLKTASPEEKRAWNARKVQLAVDRKHAVLEEFSKKVGKPIQPKTIGIILDPDRKVADVHMLDGFHTDVGWNSPKVKGSYVGSYSYG